MSQYRTDCSVPSTPSAPVDPVARGKHLLHPADVPGSNFSVMFRRRQRQRRTVNNLLPVCAQYIWAIVSCTACKAQHSLPCWLYDSLPRLVVGRYRNVPRVIVP